jgi:hypothetical protein
MQCIHDVLQQKHELCYVKLSKHIMKTFVVDLEVRHTQRGG